MKIDIEEKKVTKEEIIKHLEEEGPIIVLINYNVLQNHKIKKEEVCPW